MIKFLINRNFLICLVGLPASGKSIFANKLKVALKKRFGNQDVKIIDPDIIRQKLTPDQFNHEKEHIVRNENLKIIKEELEKGNIVISDDLNYYSSMRHDLKNIADTLNLNFFIIHIATSIRTCLKWNKERDKPIPNNVIKRIHERFDEFNKYNWDFPIAKYDISKILDLNLVVEEFLDQLETKMALLNRGVKTRKINTFSNVNNENLDKITRFYVGKLLQIPSFFLLKKRIIKLRKTFVKQNKNKALREPEILKSFKNFLEKNLNIKIYQNLL